MRRIWIAVLLLAVSCSNAGGTGSPVALRVEATPAATGRATVTVETAAPTPAAKAAASAAATTGGAPVAGAERALAAPPVLSVPVAGLPAFRGLGAWIDVFDHTNDPATIVPLVRGMAAQGTKTLYLESARYSSKGDFEFPKAMGAGLDEAKRLGMRVVAWYPPDFKDLKADVKRSVAAIRYRSPGGNRFDGFGADIEYTSGVSDHGKRSELAVEYSKRLRAAAGPTYPIAAVVIPPSWLARDNSRWPNFPWKALAASYDLFMPMEYWTALGKDTKTAYEVTKDDALRTRALTGRPVHIIGGLGEDADGKQVDAYVKAAKDSGSLGGGLYDYRTTRADVWDELRKLN